MALKLYIRGLGEVQPDQLLLARFFVVWKVLECDAEIGHEMSQGMFVSSYNLHEVLQMRFRLQCISIDQKTTPGLLRKEGI